MFAATIELRAYPGHKAPTKVPLHETHTPVIWASVRSAQPNNVQRPQKGRAAIPLPLALGLGSGHARLYVEDAWETGQVHTFVIFYVWTGCSGTVCPPKT